MLITPQKVIIENYSKRFLIVQKGGFKETACPKPQTEQVLVKSLEGLSHFSIFNILLNDQMVYFSQYMTL